MSKNWLSIAGKTVAAAGLVALLSGCDGAVSQDVDAGKNGKPSVSGQDDKQPPKPVHEIIIEIFDKTYDSAPESKVQLLEDLMVKFKEATSTDNQLQGHLRNQDLDSFQRDYQKSQEILETLTAIYSDPFARYFATHPQALARESGPTYNDLLSAVQDLSFEKFKQTIMEHAEARGPFGILFANLTQNSTKSEEYAGLEYCCADTEAQTMAAKLKLFGTNFTKEQRGGTSPVGSWKLTVVFDDKKLKAMKSGEKDRLPHGEFVELKYDEPSDMFSFCYTNRTKPNGHGNTTFTEKEFQIVDIGTHGILTGTDARLNGIHPGQLATVKKEYKDLLQRTLAVVETRYEGKFIK